MKSFVVAVLCLLLSVPLFAQSTTVSGTITDAGGQAWIRGTYSFSFKVAANNPTGPYFWNGGQFSTTQTIQGQLDGSGHFSVSVPSNTSITPAGSTWVLTLCSIARGNSPCYTTQGLTITGATQSVSSVHPPAISIDLTHVAYPFVTAYSSSEITTATFAGLFWNYTSSHYFYCEAITPSGNDQTYGACTNWVELCQVGDGLCGGAGTNITIQHNGTVVGSEPIVNFIDGTNVTLTVTNNVGATRIDTTIAASGGGGSGCTVGSLLDQWVVSIHPNATCYGSADWLWNDTLWNNTQGDGTNVLAGTDTLAFTQGSGNHQTDTQISWLTGVNSTVTCDSNTLGANCENYWMNGILNSIVNTGASSSMTGIFANGRSHAFSATGGSNVSDITCLIRSCTATAGTGGDVDDALLAGVNNSALSSGANSVTSSLYSVGESNSAQSSGAANANDNFQWGEHLSLASISSSTSVLRFNTQEGFNHTFTSSGGFSQTFGFTMGHANTASSSSSAMAEYGMIGHTLTLNNCSHCYLIGENTTNSTSNYLGIGLSSTPEVQITPGNVALTGAVLVNGSPVAGAAIQASSITTLSGDVSVSATTVTTVVTKSVTMPSSGCPCRAHINWEAGATTSNSGGVEYWVNDGTNNFATGGTNTTGSVGPPTQFHASGGSYSPSTYANSATITFTLKVESEQAIVVRQASQFSPQGSYLNVAILTSN